MKPQNPLRPFRHAVSAASLDTEVLGRPSAGGRHAAAVLESPTADPLPADSLAVDAQAEGTPARDGIQAEAAESFIESKRIGDRIKFLRQRKNMGLVELGRHTGLSASFLSQLETGRVVPTLRNLARIAIVFSKDLGYFFEPERPEFFRIMRARERQRLPQTGANEPGYFFESLGSLPLENGVVPYVAEFLPASETRPTRSHGHPGAEFLFVLSGCLRLTHEGEAADLAEGDAVFFHTTPAHSYERVGEDPCTALILTMQETPRGNHSGSRIPMRNGRMTGSNRRR